MPKTADSRFNTDAPASQAVERVLLAYWPGFAEGQVSNAIRSKLRVHTRSDCTIAFLPGWRERPETFLKIFGSPDALQHEVDGLKQAAAIVMESQVAVPRILDVLPAENAVLLEHIAGLTLDRLLRRRLIDPRERINGVWPQLGAWLRRLNDSEIVGDEPARLLAEWSAALERYLTPLHGLLGPHRVGQIRSLQNALVRTIMREPATLVRCHGDFALGNCIVNGQRVWITDFAYSRFGPREMDLERLWASLEDAIGFFPATQTLRSEIQREFAQGYGSEQTRPSATADLIHLELRVERIYFLSKHVPASVLKRTWRRYLRKRTTDDLGRWTQSRLDHHLRQQGR